MPSVFLLKAAIVFSYIVCVCRRHVVNAEGVLCFLESTRWKRQINLCSIVQSTISIDTELVDGCLVGVGVCLSVSLTDCVLGAFDKYVRSD